MVYYTAKKDGICLCLQDIKINILKFLKYLKHIGVDINYNNNILYIMSSNKSSIRNENNHRKTNSQNIADKFTELADRLLAFPNIEDQFRIELDDMSGQLYSAISNFSNNLSTTDTILFRQPGKFNPLYDNTTITIH